jgi:hypothetical protein
LFGPLRDALRIYHFASDQEVKKAVLALLVTHQPFFGGVKKLVDCWAKCVETDGNYNLQGMHPVVLFYITSSFGFLLDTTTFKILFISHYSEFIGLNSMAMCYKFLLLKPSSGSTH